MGRRSVGSGRPARQGRPGQTQESLEAAGRQKGQEPEGMAVAPRIGGRLQGCAAAGTDAKLAGAAEPETWAPDRTGLESQAGGGRFQRKWIQAAVSGRFRRPQAGLLKRRQKWRQEEKLKSHYKSFILLLSRLFSNLRGTGRRQRRRETIVVPSPAVVVVVENNAGHEENQRQHVRWISKHGVALPGGDVDEAPLADRVVHALHLDGATRRPGRQHVEKLVEGGVGVTRHALVRAQGGHRKAHMTRNNEGVQQLPFEDRTSSLVGVRRRSEGQILQLHEAALRRRRQQSGAGGIWVGLWRTSASTTAIQPWAHHASEQKGCHHIHLASKSSNILTEGYLPRTGLVVGGSHSWVAMVQRSSLKDVRFGPAVGLPSVRYSMSYRSYSSLIQKGVLYTMKVIIGTAPNA